MSTRTQITMNVNNMTEEYGLLRAGETHEVDADLAERFVRFGFARLVAAVVKPAAKPKAQPKADADEAPAVETE